MEKIKIIGGYPLRGYIKIQGAKNSALPLATAALLSDEGLTLYNVPHLLDMEILFNILRELNAEVDFLEDGTALIRTQNVNKYTASYELANQMRASVLILGPLLSKFHAAKVPLPGGCSIGARPVDMHITALQQMGANIVLEHGHIVATCNGGLYGAAINFDKVSVGATENIMMAACLAKGITTINNAALEPEIVDLANCLTKMGAKIKGAGTSLIEIIGVNSLKKAEYTVMADRIEAGSYAIATLATKGHCVLENVDTAIFGDFLDYLRRAGGEVNVSKPFTLEISYKDDIIPLDVKTASFPNFPTDLQAPWMTLMCLAAGKSHIQENIFENRFGHVPELIRMGANIEIRAHNMAVIKGVKEFSSAEVKSTDLRAAFALIIAGLTAKGETTVTKLHHLDRGYVNTVGNLVKLGANIKRGVNI
ncbi:UDP-N-acetylglucosamine 1-carboxyvinyltransferase [Candidatus Hepatincolaceae symbiont of Richtersius coronifer]